MKIIANTFLLIWFCSLSYISYSNEHLWCHRNTINKIFFDEDDFEICEEIISYALLGQEELRDSTQIMIDTNENYTSRDRWIASFTFKNGDQKFYLYSVAEKNKITELTLAQFKEYYNLITECNDTVAPLYSEN